MVRVLILGLSILITSLVSEHGLAESIQPRALDNAPKPYAEWVALPKPQSKLASTLYNYQSRSVPSSTDVNVPTYPRSKLLMVDEERLRTSQDNQNHPVKRTLVLVSTDAVSKVIEWYSHHLTDYFLHKEEGRNLFLLGNNEGLQTLGARAMNCTQYVVVKDLAEPFRKVMPGFNALIEISYYPASKSTSDTVVQAEECE